MVDACEHLIRFDDVAFLDRKIRHPARYAAADRDQMACDSRIGLRNMGEAVVNLETGEHDGGEDDDEDQRALKAGCATRPRLLSLRATDGFGTRAHGVGRIAIGAAWRWCSVRLVR